MAFSPLAANAATQAPAPVAYSLLVQEIKDKKVTPPPKGVGNLSLPLSLHPHVRLPTILRFGFYIFFGGS
jgi:hypothetical protein